MQNLKFIFEKMSDFKDLIRFKPVEAVEKARTTFATLIEKYK
jgi:hypothetical protein